MIGGRDCVVKITLKLIFPGIMTGPIAIGCEATRNYLTLYRLNNTPKYTTQRQKFVFEAVHWSIYKLLSLY